MRNLFFNLFNKTGQPVMRGPLGLHQRAAFTLDTLTFRLSARFLTQIPEEEYTIAASSVIEVGAGCRIYRYYTSGDEFLQINTTGGMERENIDDIKLFIYQDSFGITSEKQWQKEIGAALIGRPSLQWNERDWKRIFNENEVGNVEPVYLLEHVENNQNEKWDVHNFMMAYHREATADLYEYLLLTGEETFCDNSEPEWIFSYAVGVDIPLTSLNIVG
ncbi:DUF2491 family protein [Enterobacter quasiroggenkampii]|uniref:DUF2491 family protein n=1 Tax=Enterobacter TaxID=547 RepID=UPI002074B3AC|nr:DUF2491 family protein [Enterobacter quasiroggenkampii]MCM7168447.1 YjfK family protein [Enterobacter quasiroggenkampii]MCU6307608.1 YjfK family protein [Enterobacter quasiroggenkampii]MEB7933908.1 YjfK family protein [Enterobacter quasiroggenkampii]